jgi:hypothetical protein
MTLQRDNGLWNTCFHGQKSTTKIARTDTTIHRIALQCASPSTRIIHCTTESIDRITFVTCERHTIILATLYIHTRRTPHIPSLLLFSLLFSSIYHCPSILYSMHTLFHLLVTILSFACGLSVHSYLLLSTFFPLPPLPSLLGYRPPFSIPRSSFKVWFIIMHLAT